MKKKMKQVQHNSEDNLELNKKTIKLIENAKKRIKSGRFLSEAQAKNKLGL